MVQFSDSVSVITGAASGIGRELALLMSQKGSAVALVDINRKELEATAQLIRGNGGTCSVHVMDVSDRIKAEKLASAVTKKYGRVDVLINNAGVTLFGNVEDLSWKNMEWIMDINLWGVVNMTRAFLPELRRSPSAFLVNVSSLYGFIALPGRSFYSMTKSAVRAFTESLRQELRETGITVCGVFPGGVKTSIVKNRRVEMKMTPEEIHKAVENFERSARTTAPQAAVIITRGMERKQPRILVGFDAKLIRTFSWLPASIHDRLVRKIILSRM